MKLRLFVGCRDDVQEHLHSTIHGWSCPAAICIQRFVSSRESASHDTFRTSLRPSSITKPRYPSLSVVWRPRHMERNHVVAAYASHKGQK